MLNDFAFICTDGGCGDIVFLYFVVLPLLGVVSLSILIYLLLRIFRKNSSANNSNIKSESKSLLKILLIVFTLSIIGALTLLVLPTVFRDKTWEDGQAKCAKEAGYETPADDNSQSATAESQSIYRSCLDR